MRIASRVSASRTVRWGIPICVVAALASWFWVRVVPGHRPDLRAGERFGIDVSAHQGEVNWRAVADDGIEFAYIKATEGADFVDPRFAVNWKAARDAGLDRGAYHFFTLCRPGAERAENFLRTVPEAGRALPPAVDLEFGGNCAARPSAESLRRELRSFVDKVELATGSPVVVYVLEDFDAEYGRRRTLDRTFWVRHLFVRPPADDWYLWQVSGRAEVLGIDGPVDLNVMGSRRV